MADFHSHPFGFNENDHTHPQFEDTEPFDEAVVPDSPLMEETQLVVDNSDCDEPMRTGVSGFEEVVLDSEDEEVNGSRIVSLRDMSSERNCAAGLSYVDSQEPGEESQANALEFVDNFVSLNDDLGFDLPGLGIRKTAKVKSPPVTNTKGTQSLARLVELRSLNEKADAYEWVDSEDSEALRFLDKKLESSLVNPEGMKRSEGLRKRKLKHANDTKCIDKGDGSKERNIIRNLHREITESGGKTENDSVNASEDHLNEKPTELQLEFSEEEGNTVDMFNVGFDTQIAAEAMEALAYGALPDCNTMDVDSGCVKENKASLEHSSLPESAFSNVGDISKNVKRRHLATRIPRRAGASSQKQSKKQELYLDLPAVPTVKRSRFFGEACTNVAEDNDRLRIESPKYVQKRILQSAADYSKGSSGKHQSVSAGRSSKTEDGSNKGVDDGIVTYRRKKRGLNAQSPEIISSSEVGSDKPVEKDNVKRDNIITYRRKKRLGAKESRSVYVLMEENCNRKACSLKLGLWSHPKGKRTGRSARNKSWSIPAPSTPFLLLGKKDSFHSDERPEISNNMAGEKQSLNCPPVLSLNNTSDITLSELQSGKLVATDPTLPGTRCTAPSNPTTGKNVESKHVSHDYQKKPGNKSLPKSSLVKELVGLGVHESMPHFASKDLRRRRSTAYVQVLFSQHLDDDIIKQQKKIIARLGLSVATCSMDATHFIADQFARTRNMLEFIALGKPVVTHLWLESCGEANCLISEKSYILRDAKKEKEIGFSMLVSLDCAKRCPLLKGRKVFITPNIKPGKEMITSLVKTAQGEPVEKPQLSAAKGKRIFNELLILSCEEDEAICVPFLERGVAAYNSELLLNGIVTQRLEYKRHQLFTNVIKKDWP